MAKYCKGYRHSKEVRTKLSIAGKNKIFSKEHKEKLSIAAKGKKFSKEHRENMSIAGKDRIFSKEHREKLSIAGKDKIVSEESKKKISIANLGRIGTNGFKGRKHSEKTLKKMSIVKSGSDCYNWQGGISCEPYCDAWADQEYKDDIKERDNHICQNPDCRNNCSHLPLHIHHIDHVKKNCHPQNLITLCSSCNVRANFNKEYWIKFYQGIMVDKYDYGYKVILRVV